MDYRNKDNNRSKTSTSLPPNLLESDSKFKRVLHSSRPSVGVRLSSWTTTGGVGFSCHVHSRPGAVPTHTPSSLWGLCVLFLSGLALLRPPVSLLPSSFHVSTPLVPHLGSGRVPRGGLPGSLRLHCSGGVLFDGFPLRTRWSRRCHLLPLT